MHLPFALNAKNLMRVTLWSASLMMSIFLACGFHAHLRLFELHPMLFGFAPIAGSMILSIVVAFLLSHLISSLEETLSRDTNNAVPQRTGKSKWLIPRYQNVSEIRRSLSLKEHSPPRLILTRY